MLATSIPLPDPTTTPVLPIPEAGRYLGMGRDRSYRAARDGYLPTIALGQRRRVVPTAALLDLLRGNR